jgi:tRNA threonylcarbamoyl adenosine modification protein YeaZ
MKLIALDSSGLVASAAILEDDTLLAEYTVNYKKMHSRTLLPMLDEISKMTELDLSSVDAIAVASGPGSFTGLRIGAATAKGLGLALEKPIVEVPTLAALAFNLFDAEGIICPIMDARRQQVYTAAYRFENHRLVRLTEERAVSVADLCTELNSIPGNDSGSAEPVIFLGDGVNVCRKQIDELLKREHSYVPAHVNKQRAAAVGALGEVLYAEGKFVKAEEHVPNYLRKSQAEREREAHADS